MTTMPSSFAQQKSRSQSQMDKADQQLRDEGAIVEIYKSTVNDQGEPVALRAYRFDPTNEDSSKQPAAAIVFFFGGGWNAGTPMQFAGHCKHFASRGMVAITIEYRVASRHGVKAKECVSDAKSAIRWVRTNAKRLGIDPDRIVAAGGSAGGHLAACTEMIAGFDEPTEDQTVSSRPNALALFNPAAVLASVEGRTPFPKDKQQGLNDRMGVDAIDVSPYHHIGQHHPPTIIFHGKADTTVPYWTAEAFASKLVNQGNECQLDGFPDAGHGFFNRGRGDDKAYLETLLLLDAFLVQHGFCAKQESVKAKSPGDPD
ncbi:hypothetical protein CGZ80_17915 [Rhodopirellula sp. MGV]|nr:hypothetical protein CGZ80_17915 [Rhodopirellula sp. MGV]PNY35199.1 alpha/beta hydrolase [Rhodopirellula baltica]